MNLEGRIKRLEYIAKRRLETEMERREGLAVVEAWRRKSRQAQLPRGKTFERTQDIKKLAVNCCCLGIISLSSQSSPL